MSLRCKKKKASKEISIYIHCPLKTNKTSVRFFLAKYFFYSCFCLFVLFEISPQKEDCGAPLHIYPVHWVVFLIPNK